jgi:FMN phosphatase YigB (HAD superfamily)
MKAIVFDLDGTLYSTKDVERQNILAAINAIADHEAVNLSEASRILEENRIQLFSTSGTLNKLKIPAELVKYYQLKLINPEQSIKSDLELCSKVRALKSFFKLILLTNTRREIADKIIEKLGFLPNDFDLIWGGGDFNPPKPSVDVVRQALNMVSADALGSYAVGDRWGVDLAPAKDLGMNTVEIKSRDELISWIEQILQR